MSGLRKRSLASVSPGVGGGRGGAGRLFLNLFLFQDFRLEIGMSENPSSTGYALHFEYMYICYNYKYYPKHFWTIR